MELKITQAKVLEAAAKCSDAKRILETLFPECFAPKNKIVFKENFIEVNGEAAITTGYRHTRPEFKGSAFHLESSFKWELHEEELGYSLVFKQR